MIPVFDPAAPAASGCVATPPLVSVCMTAYNHAPYIGRAIEGVLSQRTTFAVELVLSDDCSTDGTGAICRDYAARYPDRIRLLTGDVNVGMRANYRRTIEACRGRYVAMCDGDDWWCDPLKLQRQVEALEADPACGICYTRVRCYAQEEGRYVENYPMGAGATTFEELLLNNTIPNCAAVVRRDLLAGYYADPELRPLERPWPLEDYPMWLRRGPRRPAARCGSGWRRAARSGFWTARRRFSAYCPTAAVTSRRWIVGSSISMRFSTSSAGSTPATAAAVSGGGSPGCAWNISSR